MQAIGKLFKETPKYTKGSYSKSNDDEQWIRITDGCPNNCEYCYAPGDMEYYGIPEINRNKVKIMDMNFLAQPKAFDLLQELYDTKVNNKVVYYELICGIDYRFLTEKIATRLYNARFKNIRFAWDYGIKYQYKIKDAYKILIKAGYKPKDLMVFMICNWKTPYNECCQKLDLLKIWNCKVSDCYFDNQTTRKIEPIHWTVEQIKSFRAKCRLHNQMILFGINPNIKGSN